MDAAQNQSRRLFLQKTFITAAGITMASSLLPTGNANAGYINRKIDKTVLNGQDFLVGVMPRALLSIQASQLAVHKAIQNNAREFAGFELMEAITVVKVLRELGIAQSPPDKEGEAFIETLKTASGPGFDKLYMHAELSNHEFLRDLASQYLQNENNIPTAEQEIKHIATIALFAFKEHVGMCKRIYGEVSA